MRGLVGEGLPPLWYDKRHCKRVNLPSHQAGCLWFLVHRNAGQQGMSRAGSLHHRQHQLTDICHFSRVYTDGNQVILLGVTLGIGKHMEWMAKWMFSRQRLKVTADLLSVEAEDRPPINILLHSLSRLSHPVGDKCQKMDKLLFRQSQERGAFMGRILSLGRSSIYLLILLVYRFSSSGIDRTSLLLVQIGLLLFLFIHHFLIYRRVVIDGFAEIWRKGCWAHTSLAFHLSLGQ